MTRSRRARGLVAAGTAVALAALVAGPGTAARDRAAASGSVVKNVRVAWSGADDRDYTETAKVPGIGTLKLVCKPNNTIIRLYAESREPETQMWLAKYEWKNDRRVVAVKNARIYRYANANDDGLGGTGRSAQEGLNQKPSVENRSEGGYAYGLISQRPGRHQPAGGAALRPVTAFYLTWFWNGFEHPRAYQSCDFRLRLVTQLDQRIGINWHGDQDAAGHELRTATVPGLGELQLTCETGRDNERSIALLPASADPSSSSVYYEEITGEGAAEDHVESGELDYDPETGLIGPLELPRNGMIRLWYAVNGVTRAFTLSSYQVTNNAAHPELNTCEVAVGAAV